MANLKVSDILGAIRDNASTMYQERVEEYNGQNLAQIGDAITADSNIMNEFLGSLINKVGLSNVKVKMYNNPLALLKSTGVPMGATIEEIYVNPAVDAGFDSDGTKLLKTTTPDVKTAYYGMNRKSSYPVSIQLPMLQRGFRNEQEFMTMYNAIITSMYSGDAIDEFLLTKKVVGETIDAGAMRVVSVDMKNPKEASKTMSIMSEMMSFANTEYCGYNLVNATDIASGATPCITFCDPSEQVLLITASAKNTINYDVLASMFNMEVASVKAMSIVVDDIPSTKHNVVAMLCDREAIQIRDYQYVVKSMDNGSNLTTNFWLHHWQYVFISMFGNAIAFADDTETEPTTP